jgi:hypothetical protein
MALTVNYVSQTVHQLPNLFATRVTTSFEDKPAAFTGHGGVTSTLYEPVHVVGHAAVTVTFRDGREVVEKSALDTKARMLNTSGVFGPILGTVIVDAARSKLAWSHWEAGPDGPEAVFGFAVPKEKSHYTITYDSVPKEASACSTTPQTVSEVVAYHGEMVIDAASGTILRLMLQADMKPDEFTVKSGIEVEYRQVSLGGKFYFLPVRSVSSSLAHSVEVVEGVCPVLEAGKTPMAKQPLPDATRAGQNANLKGPAVRYNVNFFVRLSDVALQVDSKGDHDGKLEAGLMGYDRDGNPVNWDRITLAMNLRQAEFGAMQKSGIPVHMEIDLPVEYAYLVTGVYDWSSGKSGSLEVPMQSGAPAEAPATP